MTPQLQQALKLLQYNSVELAEFLNEELERNPLLALADGESLETDADQETRKNEASEDMDVREVDVERPMELTTEVAESYSENISPDDAVQAWEGESLNIRRLTYQGEDDEGAERGIVRPVTLREHVEQQILIDFYNPSERLIALQLLDHLDDSGYLGKEYAQVATQLGCTTEQLDAVINMLQHLEPAGLFARDLSECLRLQLREKDRLDPAMDGLVSNLDLVASAEWNKLGRICGVGEEDIREMCREIRELNPKPGLAFERSVAAGWQPDVFVRRTPEGFRLEINPEAMPRVLFHRAYYSEIVSKTKDKAEKKVLTEYAQSANWLVRALEQRAKNMLAVATEIITEQHAFLEHGVYYLKPMTFKDIAEKVGIHESTVGRVVNGKYMATPKGVFEFRYFFSTGLTSVAAPQGGDEVSSHAIRHAIAELVEQETVADILSDDTIANLLKSRGFEVARRTVAKYRELQGIPGSSERRKAKKLEAAMKA